jgi:hypothetical protein
MSRKYKLADKWAHNATGEWLDDSGDVITQERAMRHLESIKIAIVAHFPKGYCKNSREEFPALVNNGIEEVYRSLTKFNKHECLTKVNSSAKFKRMSDADRLHWKQTHQEEALFKGEHEWVKNALMRFYWRIRFDNSDQQLGGTEIPTDFQAMQNECYAREEMDDGNSFGPDHGADVIPMREFSTTQNPMLGVDVKQAMVDLEMLADIRETEGDEAFHEHFKLMSADRQENLREFYLNRQNDDDSAESQTEYLGRMYVASNEESQQEDESQEESNEDIISEGDAE